VKAVVLNHTGYENHHGCRAVMAAIYGGLRQRGVRVIAASPVRHKWWRDAGLMRAVSAADVIVINGEGTLHHGAVHGERLLQIVDHPARKGAPVVLINALYQDNPPLWNRYLERLDFISVRDTRSRAALQRQGFEVHETPDFSMVGAAPTPTSRSASGVIAYGDSVLPQVSADFERLYRSRTGPKKKLPIWASLKYWAPAPLGYVLNAPYLAADAVRSFAEPNTRRFATTDGFLRELGSVGLFLTGRFHGAALALRMRTPFLAAGSNSHKVEALLEDCGLNTSRLIDASSVGEVAVEDWRFSKAETDAIESYIARAQTGADDVFDRIAASARSR
jgi:hypothetical protein